MAKNLITQILSRNEIDVYPDVYRGADMCKQFSQQTLKAIELLKRKGYVVEKLDYKALINTHIVHNTIVEEQYTTWWGKVRTRKVPKLSYGKEVMETYYKVSLPESNMKGKLP